MTYKNGFLVWDEEFERKIFTPEEIAASNIRVAVMQELVKARDKGVKIKDIAKKTGVKKSKIKKLAGWEEEPKFETVINVLLALGKTLAITDFDRDGGADKANENAADGKEPRN